MNHSCILFISKAKPNVFFMMASRRSRMGFTKYYDGTAPASNYHHLAICSRGNLLLLLTIRDDGWIIGMTRILWRRRTHVT